MRRHIPYLLLVVSTLLVLPVWSQSFIPGKINAKVNVDQKQAFAGEDYPEKYAELQSRFGLVIEPKFTRHPETGTGGPVDIHRIYSIQFSTDYHPAKVSKALMETGLFDYAEPAFIGQLAYTPNDPELNKQLYLQTIGAYDAWDVHKGSNTVLIGVVDAGIDTTHEDLKGNLYRNPADPINGIDDDQDGFTDNYYGWNLNDDNHEVNFTDQVDHGVQMAGAISPVTDNNTGIGGVAFSCKMMTIKVTERSEVLYGYEGIKYAADHGCQIINCSWNFKTHSQFGEDMVNYATYNKGALVVAATGNQGREDLNYPAKYEAVLSVANVDYNGNAMSNSNFGYYVDISAPGLNIYSTKGGNAYGSNSGSSYSCAIVSGCAALLRSYQPTLTPQEIKSRLKATATDIYANGQNDYYKNKFGSGSVHFGRAMTYGGAAYPEWIGSEVTESDNGVSEPGDTLDVLVQFANYLDPSSGAYQLLLKSRNGYAQILQPNSSLRALASNDSAHADSAFQLTISAGVPHNYPLQLEVLVIQGNDTLNYGFSHLVNPTYYIIDQNNITTSLGTRGTYGWYEYPAIAGKGVTYKGGAQLLHEGGLMIGNELQNQITVVDRLRGFQYVEQRDFIAIRGLSAVSITGIPFAINGAFDDSNAKDELGVRVEQHAFAWNGDERDNFVLFEYDVFSRNNQDLQDLYIGMMSDWDIGNYEKNRADYDGKRYLAYTWELTEEDLFCGMQLISLEKNWKTYAIDNVAGGGGGIDITDNDVYSKEEKYYTLSTTREQGGMQTGGSDVLQVISSGPHDVPLGDTLSFKVAILVAENLTALQRAADSAFYLINGRLPDGYEERNQDLSIRLFPNPAQDRFTLHSSSSQITEVYITDLAGKMVAYRTREEGDILHWDIADWDKSVYLVQVQSDQGKQVFKLIVH